MRSRSHFFFPLPLPCLLARTLQVPFIASTCGIPLCDAVTAQIGGDFGLTSTYLPTYLEVCYLPLLERPRQDRATIHSLAIL